MPSSQSFKEAKKQVSNWNGVFCFGGRVYCPQEWQSAVDGMAQDPVTEEALVRFMFGDRAVIVAIKSDLSWRKVSRIPRTISWVSRIEDLPQCWKQRALSCNEISWGFDDNMRCAVLEFEIPTTPARRPRQTRAKALVV